VAAAGVKARVGVIGAGSWAVFSHLPVLAARDDVELVAVSRLGARELEEVRERFGFALASEDYRDVLAADLDVCLVCTPAALHHRQALEALEAGAHVMVEKPFTLDPAEAWDLVAAAERLERHLLVAYGYNYLAPALELERLLEARGGIGAIEQVSFSMHSCCRELLGRGEAYPVDGTDVPAPDAATWIDPALSGGGYGQAQLTHVLGLGLRLTGLRGASARALMAAPGGAPVELHDAIALGFAGGAIGTLTGGSSWVGADGSRDVVQLRAIGSRGQWELDLAHDVAWVFVDDGRGEDRLSLAPGAGEYDCIGPPETIVDLALGDAAVNRSPGELAARTVEILDACYRSAAAGESAAVTVD
jgi:predicted dehydrogenase